MIFSKIQITTVLSLNLTVFSVMEKINKAKKIKLFKKSFTLFHLLKESRHVKKIPECFVFYSAMVENG